MCRRLHWSPALADVSELKVNEKGIKIEFPNKDDIMEMKIKIMPYDGHYKDGTCACAARERHTHASACPSPAAAQPLGCWAPAERVLLATCAAVVFDCKVPKSYPHDPPKILCETQVFHPNIDMEGHVCLNILREDWKPVLTISSVIMGLQFLMLEPNADDPLNKQAAKLMIDYPSEFANKVSQTMSGRSMTIEGKQYHFEKFR